MTPRRGPRLTRSRHRVTASKPFSSVVNRFLDELRKVMNVIQYQRAAAALDETRTLEDLELACERLPAGADSRGDLSMHRRRRYDRAAGVSRLRPRQPQQFGINPVTHVEGAEFVDAIG